MSPKEKQLDLLTHTCNFSAEEARQEDNDFDIGIDKRVNSRPV
jgi:hypothetical protein